MTNRSDQLAALQEQALSSDAAVAHEAFSELTDIGTTDVVVFFLHLLRSNNTDWRNKAAMALADIADPQAMIQLLQAIQRPENRNANGTLVYALTKFNCQYLIKELFSIVFYQEYEAQLMALNALEEQDFIYSAEDVESIRQEWAIVCLSPSLSLKNIGLDAIQEMIEAL